MTWQVAGLWLIAFGGASNLFERIYWGRVDDYWHIGRVGFNLADVVIIAGAGIVLANVVKNVLKWYKRTI